MYRKFIAALIGGLTLAAGAAFAQAYPSKPVTIIVPGGPGGAVDSVARVFALYLGRELGQSVILDNRAGAGGNIGTSIAAKAAPDGYTLLMAASSAHTINPALYTKVPFDPQKDFAPISLIGTAPYAIVVNPALPVRNLAELIGLAKSSRPPLIYASAGNGSLNHLLAEMFKSAAGIELAHVPYKAVAPAAVDVVSGQVNVLFGSLPGVMPLVRSGQLRALAVATRTRSRLAPDLPTMAETLPGFETNAWYGLMAPARTPRDVLARLQSATAKVLASREFIDALASQGAEPVGDTPEQFSALIAQDLSHWAKVVKQSGAKLD